jgi:hypothetical protein
MPAAPGVSVPKEGKWYKAYIGTAGVVQHVFLVAVFIALGATLTITDVVSPATPTFGFRCSSLYKFTSTTINNTRLFDPSCTLARDNVGVPIESVDPFGDFDGDADHFRLVTGGLACWAMLVWLTYVLPAVFSCCKDSCIESSVRAARAAERHASFKNTLQQLEDESKQPEHKAQPEELQEEVEIGQELYTLAISEHENALQSLSTYETDAVRYYHGIVIDVKSEKLKQHAADVQQMGAHGSDLDKQCSVAQVFADVARATRAAANTSAAVEENNCEICWQRSRYALAARAHAFIAGTHVRRAKENITGEAMYRSAISAASSACSAAMATAAGLQVGGEYPDGHDDHALLQDEPQDLITEQQKLDEFACKLIGSCSYAVIRTVKGDAKAGKEFLQQAISSLENEYQSKPSALVNAVKHKIQDIKDNDSEKAIATFREVQLQVYNDHRFVTDSGPDSVHRVQDDTNCCHGFSQSCCICMSRCLSCFCKRGRHRHVRSHRPADRESRVKWRSSIVNMTSIQEYSRFFDVATIIAVIMIDDCVDDGDVTVCVYYGGWKVFTLLYFIILMVISLYLFSRVIWQILENLPTRLKCCCSIKRIEVFCPFSIAAMVPLLVYGTITKIRFFYYVNIGIERLLIPSQRNLVLVILVAITFFQLVRLEFHMMKQGAKHDSDESAQAAESAANASVSANLEIESIRHAIEHTPSPASVELRVRVV